MISSFICNNGWCRHFNISYDDTCVCDVNCIPMHINNDWSMSLGRWVKLFIIITVHFFSIYIRYILYVPCGAKTSLIAYRQAWTQAYLVNGSNRSNEQGWASRSGRWQQTLVLITKWGARQDPPRNQIHQRRYLLIMRWCPDTLVTSSVQERTV